MKVWTCNDHNGHYVGVASVVVADDERHARALLKAELVKQGLDPNVPFTLNPLDMNTAMAYVIQNGDY